jgi:hypothetical protein
MAWTRKEKKQELPGSEIRIQGSVDPRAVLCNLKKRRTWDEKGKEKSAKRRSIRSGQFGADESKPNSSTRYLLLYCWAAARFATKRRRKTMKRE